MARKCVRFWNSRGRSAASRTNASLTSAGGLQRLAGPLAADVAGRDAPQLVVDERHQVGEAWGSPPAIHSTERVARSEGSLLSGVRF